MTKLRILAFAGSLRPESVNKKLISWTAKQLEASGHEVVTFKLEDYHLPHYNPNETSFPENAKIIAKMMQESHLWLISAPEYNYSIPGSLKDLIDYVSRAPHNKPNIGNFTDKVVGLMSASPSIWGGIRGLRHMREILSALGSLVVAPQVNITNAFSAFDQAGELIDQPNKDAVKTMLDKAINLAIKLNS